MVKGLAELQSQINDIPNKTMKGIEKAMGIIYDDSQPRVPVDTGALKRSGIVEQVDKGYKIKYHSENPKNGYNYAVIQHENTSFKHRVGQAKYLEDAIKSNMDKIEKAIIEEVVKWLRLWKIILKQ